MKQDQILKIKEKPKKEINQQVKKPISFINQQTLNVWMYNTNKSYKFVQQDIMNVIAILLLVLIGVNAKLYQIVAVISPGARYHINQLFDGKETKSMWGEITPVGLRQLENLGRYTKIQYTQKIPLLSETFSKGQFEVISTSLNRSISSGLAHLYGMYSLGNGQKLIHTDQKYHIPPYSYKSDIDETVYGLPQGQLVYNVKYNSALLEKCANEQQEIQKNIKLQLLDYNEMVLTYTPFFKKMATVFGDTNLSNFTRLAALYDTVTVDRFLGRSLPSNFNAEDLKNMEHLYHWYTHFTRSFNLSKAYNSFKASKIIEYFDARVKNPNGVSLKWTTLSVDDVDIVALQNDLNISSASCIEEIYRKGSSSALNCEQGTLFASNIIFELHSDNSQDFYIKVRNNGKYMNLCETKDQKCSYNNWRTRLAHLVVNSESICGKIAQQSKSIVIE